MSRPKFLTHLGFKRRKIWGESLHVELDDGRKIAVSTSTYKSFAHGYASTIHKSQGITVDKSYTLAGETLSSELLYVAMSRGRDSNELIASKDLFADIDALKKSLSRSMNKRLFSDYCSDDSLSYDKPEELKVDVEYASVEDAFEALEPTINRYLEDKEMLARMSMMRDQIVINQKGFTEAERDFPKEDAKRVTMLEEFKSMSKDMFKDPNKILGILGEENIYNGFKTIDIDAELLGTEALGIRSKSRKGAKKNVFHLKQLAASIDRKTMHLKEDKAGIIGDVEGGIKWKEKFNKLGGIKKYDVLKEQQLQTEQALRHVFEKFGNEAIQKLNHTGLNDTLGVQKLGHSIRMRLKMKRDFDGDE